MDNYFDFHFSNPPKDLEIAQRSKTWLQLLRDVIDDAEDLRYQVLHGEISNKNDVHYCQVKMTSLLERIQYYLKHFPLREGVDNHFHKWLADLLEWNKKGSHDLHGLH